MSWWRLARHLVQKGAFLAVLCAAMWPASVAAASSGSSALSVSGASPGSGGAGSEVMIYGSGFDDPVMVSFSCWEGSLELVAVSGTLIVVRFPAISPLLCAECSGEFTVTLLESDLSTGGGSFLYRGGQPDIYYVDPPVVDDAGGTSSPSTIAIHGAGFAGTAFVRVNGIYLDPATVLVVSSNTIVVSDLPGGDALFVQWQTVPCTEAGEVGERFIQTLLDVSVINIPPGCEGVLAGGFAMNPQDTSCRVAPTAKVVFADGFEGGDSSRWGLVVP